MPGTSLIFKGKKSRLRIETVKLKNFRNYDFLELSLDPETNIFYGDNAQGKTNILEAVYLSGTTKSHRGAKDREMIQLGHEEAHIGTRIIKNKIPYQIDIHLKKNEPKGIAVNKVPIHRASELFGIMNLVFFSPEDLNIIKSGPGGRRRFMDLELSQLDKVYYSNLTSYNRVISQRNALLKEYGSGDPTAAQSLEIWDEQLLRYGNLLIKRRKQFIDELNEIIKDTHRKLTGEKENIRLVYEPSNGDLSLEEALQKFRERDLRFKSTSVGPHRDDISFYVGNLDLRHYGSQGQQRTAALSLKLSEIELVKRKIGDTPILLLDDVLSELDQHRQEYLLDSIHDIQTLITCTGVDEFVNHRFSINKVFHVQSGQVQAVNEG